MSDAAPSWSWLFNNPELADITVRVVAEHPDGGEAHVKETAAGTDTRKRKRAPALQADPPEPLLEVPGHKQVLTSESEFLRARVLRWGEAVGAPVAQGPWGPVLELQVPAADATDCAREVLQHAYTRHLGLSKPHELLQAAVLADSWAMPACVNACLDRLASDKDIPTQLQVSHINTLLSSDLPAGVTGHVKYKALQDVCKQRVLQLFPQPHMVLSAGPLPSFCSLSFPAVLLWAGLDELQVDSENSVAALISWWWRVKRGSVGQEEAVQLTAQLRVMQLSRSYLAAVDQLPWFRPAQMALQSARFLHACNATASSYAKDIMPAGWSAKARRAAQEPPVLEAKFTRARLDDLHNRAAHGNAVTEWHPDTMHWCGYKWGLSLQLDSQQSTLLIGVRCTSDLPRSHEQPPLVGVRARVACLQLRDGSQHWKAEEHVHLGAAALPVAWSARFDLLAVPAAEQPRANSYPADSFWVEGKLQLQLTILEVQ